MFTIKGVVRCNIHFYMLFEHKCVLAVCVHIHHIMIKAPSALKQIPNIDWHRHFITDLPWVSYQQSAILSFFIIG